MADKVGKKTGLVTNYGRPVYEMEDGSRVSEISDTFKYKGIHSFPTRRSSDLDRKSVV